MNKRTIIEVVAGGLAVAGLATATVFAVNIAGERDGALSEIAVLQGQRSDLFEKVKQTERDGRYSACIALYLGVSQSYDLPDYLIREGALDYCENRNNWIAELIKEPRPGEES